MIAKTEVKNMTEKIIGKIAAIEQKTAKNGNNYLKLVIVAKDGEHSFALFSSARFAFEAKGLEEGDWVEFTEAEDEKGYKKLKAIKLTVASEEDMRAVRHQIDETAERIARSTALKLAVDTYNAGNIPASQLYETAEEYKRYILTGKIPEGVVE